MRDLIRNRVLATWDDLAEEFYRLAEAARWKVAHLLNRSDRTCWANTVSWAIDGRHAQLTEITNVAGCKAEGADPKCGACYCGKFMTPEMRAAQAALDASGRNGVRRALPGDDPWAPVVPRD